MSFLLLHDADNRVRGATITAASSEPNASVGRLQDGMLAFHWQGSQVLTHTIEMERSTPVPLSLVAVLDPRARRQPSNVQLQIFEDGSWKLPSGWQRRGSLELGGYWWSGPVETVARWRVVIPFVEPTELSIGEIVAGHPSPAPAGVRELVVGGEFGTISNGPWKTQVAAPRRSRELRFPAVLEDHVGEQLERSVGALLPVVLVPRLEGDLVLHGHLQDDWTTALSNAHHWQGQVLRFTESEKPL